MRKAILAGALIVIGAAANASAEAPNLFTYQGRLKEGGQAVSGNRTVEIKLCPVETGGVCETTGAQPVAVLNGLFRSTFTIPAAVNFGTGSWWLEIKVGADTLTPRERLTSNAYSLFSATAAYAENISAAAGSDGVYVSSNLIVVGSYASAPRLQLASGVAISSEASAGVGGGLNVSSNVYIVGFSSAARYYGDGSALTGVTATGIADGSVTDAKIVGMASSKLTGALPALDGSALTNLPVSGGAVSLAPAASQTLTYGAAGVQTILKMAAAPSADPLDIQDNAAASIFKVSKEGNVTLAGTVDGRDIAIDGATLDSLNTGAEIIGLINADPALIDDDNIAAAVARDAEIPSLETDAAHDAFAELGGQVGDAQIADAAVDGGAGGEIADGSISADDLGPNSVGSDEIIAGAVSLAKISDLAANMLLGNNTGGAAAPAALTPADVKTLLSLNNVENTALTTWAGSGNVTTLGTLASGDVPWALVSGEPTTLSGYGITDALSNSNSSTQNGFFGNLFLYDTGTPSHYLQVINGANLTAARTLTLNGGDANRTLTLTADASIGGTNTGDQTITLTGDVTGSGTGSFAATVGNSAVTGKVLTGFTSGAGTLSATDTILEAIQKLDGNASFQLSKIPAASQTVVYGAAGVQTILKMAAVPTADPFKITDSADAAVLTVSKEGGLSANSLQITGSALLAKALVEADDAGKNLTSADFGKTITVNAAAQQTITLPAVGAGDIGAQITVVKLGAGTVAIVASGGAAIADSGADGSIRNDTPAETYAVIVLRLVSATQWIITGGNGTWTTATQPS